MADAKVLLFLVVVTGLPSLLLGGAVFLAGVPLYYRLRRVPPPRRRIGPGARLLLTLAFAGLVSTTVVGYELYVKISTRNDFHRFQGEQAYWRMPLQEPWELRMHGAMDTGSIGRWREAVPVLDNVAGVAIQGGFVAGTFVAPDTSGAGWFLFDGGSAAVQRFKTPAAFLRACREAGFDVPVAIETVRHTWYVHWGIVSP